MQRNHLYALQTPLRNQLSLLRYGLLLEEAMWRRHLHRCVYRVLDYPRRLLPMTNQQQMLWWVFNANDPFHPMNLLVNAYLVTNPCPTLNKNRGNGCDESIQSNPNPMWSIEHRLLLFLWFIFTPSQAKPSDAMPCNVIRACPFLVFFLSLMFILLRTCVCLFVLYKNLLSWSEIRKKKKEYHET